MRVTARDSFAHYVIECPSDCETRRDDGTDYLLVPDPDEPAVPYWLFDEILFEAARSEEFGLRMLAEIPLN
jgi:hypothetical protein